MNQLQTLRQVYMSEIGVREQSGKNDGARVEEYLRYVGLSKGAPWCAAFVCWSLGRAGISNPRSGWSPDLFPTERIIWRKNRGSRVAESGRAASTLPEAGHVFGIYFPDKGRIAHCGFVDRWGERWMISVEGNTNEAHSRDGDGVYRKRRLCSSLYVLADWYPASLKSEKNRSSTRNL